jgi:hypothetical protein
VERAWKEKIIIMWYRLALTEIDPSGQMNFPDMGVGKLDFNDLSYKVEKRKAENYPRYGRLDPLRINAFAPGSIAPIAHIDFAYDSLSNSIVIILIQVMDNYINKDLQMTNTGRGISTKLYEQMLEYIQSDTRLSKAEHMVSNVHSLQTHKAQNRVFGNPEAIGKHRDFESAFRNFQIAQRSLDQFLEYDKSSPGRFEDRIIETKEEIDFYYNLLNSLRLDEDEALKTVLPAEWGDMGTDIGGEAFDTVHRIPKISKETKVKEKDPNQMELFDVV